MTNPSNKEKENEKSEVRSNFYSMKDWYKPIVKVRRAKDNYGVDEWYITITVKSKKRNGIL